MTDTEKKALALVKQVAEEIGDTPPTEYAGWADNVAERVSLCRAIERHEAFKREVSDAVERYLASGAVDPCKMLSRFILPKPVDPMVEAIRECDGTLFGKHSDYATALRAALAARGLEVRKIEGDA